MAGRLVAGMAIPVALTLQGHICPKGWSWAKWGLGGVCLFPFSLQLQLGWCNWV